MLHPRWKRGCGRSRVLQTSFLVRANKSSANILPSFIYSILFFSLSWSAFVRVKCRDQTVVNNLFKLSWSACLFSWTVSFNSKALKSFAYLNVFLSLSTPVHGRSPLSSTYLCETPPHPIFSLLWISIWDPFLPHNWSYYKISFECQHWASQIIRPCLQSMWAAGGPDTHHCAILLTREIFFSLD